MIDLLKRFEESKLEVSLEHLLERLEKGEDFHFVNLPKVEETYRELCDAMPWATSYIAVKANSADGIMGVLHDNGSHFEIASKGELELCLDHGIEGNRIIFTHPAKTSDALTAAANAGVTRYVSDSNEDLEQIRKYVGADAKVMIRIQTGNARAGEKADDKIDFDQRFGVKPERAMELFSYAIELNLVPYGIAFHVGTQMEDVGAWDHAVKTAADIFNKAKENGIVLDALDVGGGFPTRYHEDIPQYADYGKAIYGALLKCFGEDNLPQKIMTESGRSVSGMAGITIGRVVNVKPHEHDHRKKIVTVTTGRFSAGLYGVGHGVAFYSASEEGITRLDMQDIAPADIYGGACASFDKPLESGDPETGEGTFVPKQLKAGDIVVITGTGSYTSNMTTNWCNIAKPTTLIER